MEKDKYIIKQVDTLKSANEGILAGYANVYNIEDLQGDISRPGSFVKTVSENLKSMKIYRNHDPKQFVGVPVKLDAYDPHGLYLEAKIIMDTQLGKDTYQETKFLFENGFEAGFSIGGWVMKRDKDNRKIVTEYKLDEISILTMQPANQLSMVDMVKSIRAMDELTQEKFWQTITKAYDAKFSDDILKSLEKFLSIENTQGGEPLEDTQLIEPSENLIKSIYSLYV